MPRYTHPSHLDIMKCCALIDEIHRECDRRENVLKEPKPSIERVEAIDDNIKKLYLELNQLDICSSNTKQQDPKGASDSFLKDRINGCIERVNKLLFSSLEQSSDHFESVNAPSSTTEQVEMEASSSSTLNLDANFSSHSLDSNAYHYTCHHVYSLYLANEDLVPQGNTGNCKRFASESMGRPVWLSNNATTSQEDIYTDPTIKQ